MNQQGLESGKITKSRVIRHLIAWGIFASFVLLMILTESLEDGNEITNTYAKLLPFLGEMIFLIYSSWFLYDYFVPKRQLAKLLLGLAGLIVLVSLADHLIVPHQVLHVGRLPRMIASLMIFPVVLLVAFGIKWSYHGARQVFIIERLQMQQTESQLKLLKSQINPHFLFNTLNNIYSTNLDDHEKANEIILELADLLHYQLESNKKTKTSLDAEITSLENYIALEKIRVKDCEVSIEKRGDFSQAEIVPLLLLPFVENAFKYGTGIQKGEIAISYVLDDSKLFHFCCRNKIVQKNGRIHSGGIGLQNVKKRLDLMYKQQHQLELREENNQYLVDLKIQL